MTRGFNIAPLNRKKKTWALEPQCFILAVQLIMQNTYPISGSYTEDRNTAASVGRGLWYA